MGFGAAASTTSLFLSGPTPPNAARCALSGLAATGSPGRIESKRNNSTVACLPPRPHAARSLLVLCHARSPPRRAPAPRAPALHVPRKTTAQENEANAAPAGRRSRLPCPALPRSFGVAPPCLCSRLHPLPLAHPPTAPLCRFGSGQGLGGGKGGSATEVVSHGPSTHPHACTYTHTRRRFLIPFPESLVSVLLDAPGARVDPRPVCALVPLVPGFLQLEFPRSTMHPAALDSRLGLFVCLSLVLLPLGSPPNEPFVLARSWVAR